MSIHYNISSTPDNHPCWAKGNTLEIQGVKYPMIITEIVDETTITIRKMRWYEKLFFNLKRIWKRCRLM